MRAVVAAVVRLGDLTDALLASARAAPRNVRTALSVPRYRRVAVVSALVYLVVYLVAIMDVAISASGRFGRFAGIPSVEVVPDWGSKLLAERAPFLFEPVAVIYPLSQLAIFVSPGNILIGGVLGLLLAVNLAVALYAVSYARACGRLAYTGLLGILPAFLLGFGCCAPSILLLLGTSVAAALVPIRSFLFPLSVIAMLAMLIWVGRKLLTYERELGAPPAAEAVAAGREG